LVDSGSREQRFRASDKRDRKRGNQQRLPGGPRIEPGNRGQRDGGSQRIGQRHLIDGQVHRDGNQRGRGDGDQRRRHELQLLGSKFLPKRQDQDREDADARGRVVVVILRRHDAAPDGVRERSDVLNAVFQRFVVEHDVELADDDQYADSRQHSVNNGRRHCPKPLAEPQDAGDELNESGEQHDQADRLPTVALNQFVDKHAQPRGGARDEQRTACEHAHHDATDDAGDDSNGGGLLGRHTRRDGNSHAQRQGHEENDDRGEQVVAQRTVAEEFYEL
jgi:hypothetical protein